MIFATADGDILAGTAALERLTEIGVSAPFRMATTPPQRLVEGLQTHAAWELLPGSVSALASMLGLGGHLWKTDRGRFVFCSEEPSSRARPHHGLTARECEVMRWDCEGKTNADIASILQVTVHTLNRHIRMYVGSSMWNTANRLLSP